MQTFRGRNDQEHKQGMERENTHSMKQERTALIRGQKNQLDGKPNKVG